MTMATPAAAQSEPAAPAAAAADAVQDDEFDVEALSNLLRDARRDGRQMGRSMTPMELGARASAVARQHLRGCWEAPVDRRPASRSVTVRFSLNEDGSLNGRPELVSPRGYWIDRSLRTAAERALTAVEECAPYPFADDPVLARHYEIWRELEFVFALTPAPR
jgi:hypothetical protein